MYDYPYHWAKYLIPKTDIPYDEQRKTFQEMAFVCRFLCSDLGHMDMLVQFDDEQKYNKAKELLSQTNLKWKEL